MSSAINLPTVVEVQMFAKRNLSRLAVDVFVTEWGNTWRVVMHSRRPGALLVGRFNAFVEPADLHEAVVETIRQATGE